MKLFLILKWLADWFGVPRRHRFQSPFPWTSPLVIGPNCLLFDVLKIKQNDPRVHEERIFEIDHINEKGYIH